MYKFIKIRHDIIKQCHGNYKEMKEFNYKSENEILRNSIQIFWGVLRPVLFKGLGAQKGTQTPCWLRPCSEPFILLMVTNVKNAFTKTFKETCSFCFDCHFSFKHFPYYAFAGKISFKLSGCFCNQWVNTFMLGAPEKGPRNTRALSYQMNSLLFEHSLRHKPLCC